MKKRKASHALIKNEQKKISHKSAFFPFKDDKEVAEKPLKSVLKVIELNEKQKAKPDSYDVDMDEIAISYDQNVFVSSLHGDETLACKKRKV